MNYVKFGVASLTAGTSGLLSDGVLGRDSARLWLALSRKDACPIVRRTA